MTGAVEQRVVAVADVKRDDYFQPRTGTVDKSAIDRMKSAAQAAGHPTGWDASKYDLIRVWHAPDGDDYVLEGFHRLALAESCGVAALLAFVHVGITREEAREIADRSNLKTRPMDPIEEAVVYRRALEAGRTIDEVAREYGCRAPGALERRLSLAWLAPRLQDDVKRKLFPVDFAEVVGSAARQGASPSLQTHLADLSRHTKMRVDLYRRLVAMVLQRAKTTAVVGDADQCSLFDMGSVTETGIVASVTIAKQALEWISVRDGWTEVRRACEAQQRRYERITSCPPSHLAEWSAKAESLAAAADREVASVLGETDVVDLDTPIRAGCESKPIFKWVGGKRREAPILLPFVKQHLRKTYIEPFVGGGAVFFALAPASAWINDALQDVVDCYECLALDSAVVYRELKAYVASNGVDEAAYYRARNSEPTSTIGRTIRFLYLNRTGFNGLYRTNGSGKFNAPWGKYKDPQWPTEGEFLRAGILLRDATITCDDWRQPVTRASAGDVIFADPPYPGTFQGYATKHGIVRPDELAAELRKAWERGAHVVCTSPSLTEPYYESWCDRVALDRRTGVAASSDDRGRLDQVAWIAKRR